MNYSWASQIRTGFLPFTQVYKMVLQNLLKITFLFTLGSGLTFCHDKSVPKPHGYYRIDLPERNYHRLGHEYPYCFDIPVYTKVLPDNSPKSEPFWINILFPDFHAILHISYKKVKKNLYVLTEESHKLAYDHAVKASSIDEKIFLNPGKSVYGTIYYIHGNAASPMQFYLTDSTGNFLRGAFYISATPNIDSLKPVIEFIKTDVIHLMETLEWIDQ
jgi:gliding motility-associated lipoprotein GldD